MFINISNNLFNMLNVLLFTPLSDYLMKHCHNSCVILVTVRVGMTVAVLVFIFYCFCLFFFL